MDKTQAEIERGHLANQIEENPIWQESWETYKDKLWSQWVRSAEDDIDGRERIHMKLIIASEVRKEIKQVFLTGQMAQQQREDEEHGRQQH